MVVFTTMTKGHKINLDQKLIEQKRKKISEGITEDNKNMSSALKPLFQL